MFVLRGSTVLLGIVSTATAVWLDYEFQGQSGTIMDIWWMYSGMIGGGMFGLFLLAWLSPRIPSWGAMTGVLVTLPVLTWGRFKHLIPDGSPYKWIDYPMHKNLTGLLAVFAVLLVGGILALAVHCGWVKPNPRFTDDEGQRDSLAE